MRRVGTRQTRDISAKPSGELLKEGALFNEALARLGPATFIPKGVYRFKSHEEANRQADECLAQGMARLTISRQQARDK